MDALHIDGNGVAGLLAEIGGAEMTEVLRACPACADCRPVGEHLAFRSAGVVLRCAKCADVAVVVGVLETRLVVEWRGIFEVAR